MDHSKETDEVWLTVSKQIETKSDCQKVQFRKIMEWKQNLEILTSFSTTYKRLSLNDESIGISTPMTRVTFPQSPVTYRIKKYSEKYPRKFLLH